VAGLLDQADGGVGAAHDHDHVRRLVAGIEDGAVEDDRGAAEAGVDADPGVGQGGGDAQLALGRGGALRGGGLHGGRRGRQSLDHSATPGAKPNSSEGRTNSSRPIWMPTNSTIRPSTARNSSARKRPDQRAPYCAPTTPPSSRIVDSTMSTVWLR